jgi:hypothetical protein
MMINYNSTKRNRDCSQGRRDEYLNRINSTPISIDVPQEPKSLVSAKSKGPNTGGNVSYNPDPNDQFMHKNDPLHIPSGLYTLQQNGRIHITSDIIRAGDGRFLRSYSDSSGSSRSDGSQRRSAPGPTRPTSDSNSNSTSEE